MYQIFRCYVFALLLLFIVCNNACAPESSPVRLDFAAALDRLKTIEKLVLEKNEVEAREQISSLKRSLPDSFPLKISKPFSPHSFQDLLMKDTRAIKNVGSSQIADLWSNFLTALDGRHFFHENVNVVLNTDVLRSVLKGDEPKLNARLLTDFSTVTAKEQREINNISLESFWQPSFLYSADPNISSVRSTGIVMVKHDDVLVGFLQFENHLASDKKVNLKSPSDLVNVTPKTPGYVSSVARLASYSGFDIGKMMFDEFFNYARKNGIKDSYLFVRTDNDSAITLYKNVGYEIVATLPGYYRTPPADANVMHKKI